MSTHSHRHVIVEGPDGAGKSTLVKYLADVLDLRVARRVSDSIQGVKGKDLQAYVDEDMGRWANNASGNPNLHSQAWVTPTPSRLYDRYPLISEPIYGHNVRHNPQPAFLSEWYRDAWRKFIELDPIVVWCLPPYSEVAGNVSPNRDMDGVWTNLLPLYRAYTTEALKYPGTSIPYDYTTQRPDDLIGTLSRHLEI